MENSIRSLVTAVAVLLSSYGLMPAAIADDFDKVVHGPVDLPNGQVLSFFEKDHRVWGEVFDGDAPGVRIDEYGPVQIVAVFYLDFDKGGAKEVVVMLKDESGQHLRGYAFEGEQLIKLPRLQPQLDAIAPSLKTFTVGNVRKVLSQLPPQQYRMTYEAEGVKDPEIKAILDGTSKHKPTLIGYRNSEGAATDVKTAVEYKLRYPVTRTDKDTEGRERQYSLVATFDRSAYVEEDGSFMLVAIGYEADDANWLKSGGAKIPRTGPFYEFMSMGSSWAGVASEANYVQGELDGHFAAYDARNGSVMYAGDYKLGKQVGKWMEADSRETYWEGEYLDGKKQGKWVLRSVMDDADNYGFIHYNKGVPDGPSEIYTLDYDSGTEGAKKLSEKGIYLNGVKDGEWLESDGSKGQYQKGVKQGAWTEKVTQGDYRFQTGEGSYLDGKRSGTWVYIRTPDANDSFITKQSVTYLYKTEVNYENGLRQGEAKLFNKDNFMFALTQYDKGRLHGQSLWYSGPNAVSNVVNYRQGELDGPQMWLEPNGNLNQLSHYKFNAAVKLKPSQDECMMRKEPYAGDCEGVLNAKNTETSSIKDGEQRVYHGGKLSELAYYTNGAVDKEYRFDNGRLLSLETHQQGKEHGLSLYYHTSGDYSLSRYSQSINNRLTGASYSFHPNGQLRQLSNFCQQEGEMWNGQPYFWSNAGARCGIQRSYHENGKLECLEDIDSEFVMDEVCYDANGVIAHEMIRVDERNVIKKRYINGALYQEEPAFAKYSSEAKGRTIYHFNATDYHGVFKIFNVNNGQLEYETKYDIGKAVCTKKYDAAGKQTPETASCQF